MAELLFREDAYLRSCEATVVAVHGDAAELDWARRHRLMRLHSALHLLGAVVKAPVTGGRIAEDKAHLDFDIDMSRLVAAEIEGRVNELVRAAVGTRARWIT